MDDRRQEDARPKDQPGEKPQPGPGAGKIDDKTSKAQEDAAKERAEQGGYQ